MMLLHKRSLATVCMLTSILSLVLQAVSGSNEVDLDQPVAEVREMLYMYLHIPKTGGTSLRHHIPSLLNLDHCNSKYNIPSCCASKGGAITNKSLSTLMAKFSYPNLWNQCNFLDYEWKRVHMEQRMSGLGYNVSTDFAVLSSFREPTSHFLSSFEHLQLKRAEAPNLFLPTTLDELINVLKSKQSIPFYDLRNFQSGYMSSHLSSEEPLLMRINYMRSLYWFSITENYELSLKLLQCQVFGYVDERKLKNVLSKKYNVRTDQKNSDAAYSFTAQNLRDIKDLTSDDILFYEMAVVEFWKRVKTYNSCLQHAFAK